MNRQAGIVTDLQRQLKELVEPRSIVAVYLFGSHARNEADAASDMDLAFLLDQEKYMTDPYEAAGPAYIVAMRVGMKLEVQTDVTILNSASIEMTYEIVTLGRCVYEADIDHRLEYETRVRGMYFDFRPFLEDLRSKFLSRL